MLKSVLLFSLFFLVNSSQAQIDSLFGMYNEQSENRLITISLLDNSMADAGLFTEIQSFSLGEHCSDQDSLRYIRKTNLGITFIDIQNGIILDTIPIDSINLRNIQYDLNSNKIFGEFSDGGFKFGQLDMATKLFSEVSTLSGVSNTSAGESCFDYVNGRYFVRSNVGVLSIDIQNGAILATIPLDSISIRGIEYSENLNAILGIYNDGDTLHFMSYDLSLENFQEIGILPDIGTINPTETTFDQENGRYFVKASDTIWGIDVQNAIVLHSIPDTLSIHGIEYFNSPSYLELFDYQQKDQVRVYPNPTQGKLTLGSLPTETQSIIILDPYGRKVQSYQVSETSSQSIDVSILPKGLYYLQIDTMGQNLYRVVKQ